MRSAFHPFCLLSILFSLQIVISSKPLGLLLPDKVIPTLLQDAFSTPHLLGYLFLGLTGYFILLILTSAIAAWLARAISHCCKSIQPRFCSPLAVILVFASVTGGNTIFFPHSTAAIPNLTALFVFLISILLNGGIFFAYIIFLVRAHQILSLLRITLIILFIFLISLPNFAYWPLASLPRAWGGTPFNQITLESKELPHVILIGIDSLRPDYTSLVENRTSTPNVNAFLNQAVSFPEAYTPIARTFPAWVSILTGRYPWEVGAPFNLTKASPSATAEAFPHDFQAAGYRTLFISDEKRFSNIDQSFGYQEVAGPVMGSADFLLGSFNDTALTNLFANGRFGKWFFPFSHANRAAYSTYSPETFLRLLSSRIPPSPQSPQFISMHLCLPHDPFLWKDAPALPAGQGNNKTLYELSLGAVDNQFGKILKMFGEKGYLNNAWVVLLSDHGEGLGEPLFESIDRTQNKRVLDKKPLAVQSDWGHGTSILSHRQHRVVLAFHHYGDEAWQGGVRQQPAILADILPTLMDVIGISRASSGSHTLQSMSLLPAIRHDSLLRQRPIFFETGLNPHNITLNAGNIGFNGIQKGMALYTIDSVTGRLLLKTEVITKESNEKSYGMMQDGKFMGVLSPDQYGKRLLAYQAGFKEPLEFYEDSSGLPKEGHAMWQKLQEERLSVMLNAE